MEVLDEYLGCSATVESTHPDITSLAERLKAETPRETAIQLYYYVRDSIRYNPYAIDLSIEGMKASTTLKQGEGWCVPKAVLLAALYRAAGLPARLGFADVRNHLSTERMRQSMGTDVFYFHGYCSVFLEGKWRKCTPAFNLSLCEKMNLKPLEFDGINDSLYHPFDNAGQRHMEYLHERGEYIDVPLEDMLATFGEHYAHIAGFDSADWSADVDAEARQLLSK